MADYTKAAATASKLITANGRSLTLRHFTSTGPDYAPVLTAVDDAVIGVVLPYSLNSVDGTLIQQDDKKVLLSSAIAPTPDGKVVMASVVYSVVSIKELNPGGTVVFYQVQIRR